jgi:hypothetical protein
MIYRNREVLILGNIGFNPSMAPSGPLRVKLSGTVRGDANGPDSGASINMPSIAEATAELHRLARVNGAEAVLSVSTDYRRAALAAGPLQTLWRIDVEAYGTIASTPQAEAEAEAEQAAKAEDAAGSGAAAQVPDDAQR